MVVPPQKHEIKISSSDAGVDARTMPILVLILTHRTDVCTCSLDPLHTYIGGGSYGFEWDRSDDLEWSGYHIG